VSGSNGDEEPLGGGGNAVAAAVALRVLDVAELLFVALFAAICKMPIARALRSLVATSGAARFAWR
jgi:hypothetical protein